MSKEALVVIADAYLAAVQHSVSTVVTVRGAIAAIDVNSDMVFLVDKVTDAVGPNDSSFLVELPSAVSFSVITSELVDEERRHMKQAMASSASPPVATENSSFPADVGSFPVVNSSPTVNICDLFKFSFTSL